MVYGAGGGSGNLKITDTHPGPTIVLADRAEALELLLAIDAAHAAGKGEELITALRQYLEGALGDSRSMDTGGITL